MKTPYKKPDWAGDQIIRETGLVEDICEHGIGHPNKEWLAEHDPDNKKCFAVHGCDGCCSQDMCYLEGGKEMDGMICIHQLLRQYLDVFEPIENMVKTNPMKLRDIITELKQTDGEHWVVGEMLERLLNFLTSLEVDNKK